jgi:predicted dehydrogenase
MDFMVHDFDWLQWTFGEAERVYARILKARGVDSIEYALVTIRFKSGMIAHVNGNWAYPIKGFQSEFEIAGDMGLLSFDSLCQSSMSVYTKPGEGRSVLVPSDYAYKEDPYFLELKHFVDCMEKGDKPMVTPEDGMRAVRLGQAALESALTGHSIELGNYKI